MEVFPVLKNGKPFGVADARQVKASNGVLVFADPEPEKEAPAPAADPYRRKPADGKKSK